VTRAWRIPLVDLAAEYAEVGPAVEAAVTRVLRSGRYVLGPETAAFEEEFARSVGVAHAVGVGSGTDALHLALRALDVGPGREVVTSAFTYFAVVEAIVQTGARPVYADVDPDMNLDPDALAELVGPRTAAIVPVHLFGRCADMERIREIAGRIPVVEDAAQAVGAARGGRRAGSLGRAGCFSFHPSKNLGGVGDGGAITTDDPELAWRLRLLRSHGQTEKGSHALVGTTSRLDAVQAAALRAKLPHLARWNAARARCARLYAEALADAPGVRVPRAAPGEEPAWHQLTLRVSEPERVRAALEDAGIEWRHYYPAPVYRQPALGAEALPEGTCPEAERAAREVVSIPVRPSLEEAQVLEVAAVIRRACA